ncbi:type II toxin-antitoxin system RelE/ParE family toxin [Melioribacter sp. Ez-97]|uniref:type II toxin-antitoxin system RelE/ParE family toxin n=1 Tax=Melioribacter sp. Ez-97 TaxID=3423434 RepID=UPI003ED863C8
MLTGINIFVTFDEVKWSIQYYSKDVEKNILSLPDGLLARYLRLTDLMIEFGYNLGMPHTRFIEGGLIGLRIKSKEGIARVYYCTKPGNKIIMLHTFIKKSNRVPKREIKTALKRMKETLKK